MRRITFVLLFLYFSCAQLSREEQFQAECEKTRKRSYVFMLPILERHTTGGNTEQNSLVWIGNTELAYKKCISEAEKNKFNLRSN
ncbi:hypothetical protein CH359_11970 [Leptospira meyeri]|uniref:hypothetical protein n=1 Tax=Leptospira meyeri TaxID=29508 RepID=UPI000C298108|nr:hypothetical protein [Leptospira meyeri]PKA25063.1 hypothetical protein CH381_17480 [Leptospira sp. mixed culture ATI2-C-A1]MCW7490541.1 hypothetical protein [Leptospira meyeri]PJZ80509.1 hypothetical protein CH359_11970 [Leptospira meyeri]PJZ95753.1 hypothetical protein CH358_15485 [Leptospira meyeri]PKA13434.1 hypothetical protein CH372_03665 [Leptospira meyeri]